MASMTTNTTGRREISPLAARVQGIHHVSFRVDDLATSLDFYDGLLGCQRIERPDMGFAGAWFVAGTVQLHLLELPADPTTGTSPTQPTAMANHLAFGVDDVAAVREYFEERGVDVYVHPSSDTQCWIQDPDGNVIEFIASA